MKAHKNLIAAALLLVFFAAALPALAEGGVVNVNKASESELALLPRIGPSLAARIVDFREENGELESIEDLMLVSGIGEKTFELLRPWVVLSGETTLTSKVTLAQAQERAAASEKSGEKAPKEKDGEE